MQLFVVQVKDKCYVFDNHEAALKCRLELKASHYRLWGCGVNSIWPLDTGDTHGKGLRSDCDVHAPLEGGTACPSEA